MTDKPAFKVTGKGTRVSEKGGENLKALQIPLWIKRLTPFGYGPAVPIESISFATAAVLTVIAIGLMVVGTIQYSKRDMVS